MKMLFQSLAIAFLLSSSDAAEPALAIVRPGTKIPAITLTSGKVYQNATVKELTEASVLITHENGVARIQWFELTEDWRNQFGFDPKAATAAQVEEEERHRLLLEAAAARKRAASASQREEIEAAAAYKKKNQGPPGVESVLPGIRSQASADWPNDYGMQEYVIKRQVAAYNQLVQIKSEKKVPEHIIQKAENEWPGDYGMITYVIEKEHAAYLRLNQ
jgi:hypothetical protein